MKIKVVSDLHLEFSDIEIPNNGCDVLILSGDIMIAQDMHDHSAPDPYSPGGQAAFGRRVEAAMRFRNFLKRVSDAFPHVVYVAGNHEFYHGKFYASIEHLAEECAKFPNVYFLERGYKKIDDVAFIGGTLWTDCNKYDPLTMHALRDMMNDFRIIRHDYAGYRTLKPSDIAERHKLTLGYFKHVLDEHREDKCVIVGHHSPSHQSIHPQYAHDTLMNGGYHSDLSQFILDHPQIVLWTHGHTHHRFDYKIGDTRIVCNPRGYEGWEGDTGWDINEIIEI